MHITEYRVRFCPTCFWITGFTDESFNGTVPVQCSCELRQNKERPNPGMVGFVRNEKVHFAWRPISDHIEKDGRSWHASYLVGMGWSSGKPEDQGVFDAWAKEHMADKST